MLNDADDPLLQAASGHRLCQIFRDPVVARFFNVGHFHMPGQHNDRHVEVGIGGVGSDAARELVTVHRLHGCISDQNVRNFFFVDLQGALTITRGHDFSKPHCDQQVVYESSHIGAVIDEHRFQDAEVVFLLGHLIHVKFVCWMQWAKNK